MTKTVIHFALSRLNRINNGKSIFETFCHKLIPVAIDPTFLPSSGTDAGGDGGLDGCGLFENGDKIKYAFSIQESYSLKIKEEVEKTNWEQYQEVRFFTNQSIRQKEKEKLYKLYSENGKGKLLIFDIENLAEYIERFEELGQYVDLPRIQSSITIDYLKKHNQLESKKDEIFRYIPRTVRFYDNSTNKQNEKSFLEYCKDLPRFTILQAPAGYGKTCAMQQLHQKILYEISDNALPPVFIMLADYEPGSLLTMIEQGMRSSGDYRCNDFLLLLDGYDEVNDSTRQSLVKEISQIINNNSEIRKVMLSVRESTYSFNDFEDLGKKNIIMLASLTVDNINELFLNESIPQEKGKEFFCNTFFQGFLDNIFYVVKFIDYYKVNNSIAENVTDLFSYILNQEINRIFKKVKPSESALESLALHMSLNQILSIDDIETIKKFGITLPSRPFRFSHKSIQEYLAARKISRQPIEVIIEILGKGNLIIPYLTNTMGFVLNILNTSEAGYTTFIKLVEWSLSAEGNAKRLLQIEADKIDNKMNHSIFKAVMEQESKSGSFFDQPEALIPFALFEDSREKNLHYLINFIIGSKDTENFHYHTSVLQSITYHRIDSLGEKFQKDIINFFIVLLRPENIKKNINLVESLLYSISYFPTLKKLKEEDINYIYDKLLLIERNEHIINNLCQLLITSEKQLDFNIYCSLYDFVVDRVISERGQMAHVVPIQTSDDIYHEPLRLTHWQSFIPLTQQFINEDTSTVWKIFHHTIERKIAKKEKHFSYAEFDELFTIFFNVAIIDIEFFGFDDRKRKLIIEWISNDIEDYQRSCLWEKLKKNFDPTELSDIMKDVIVQTKCRFLQYNDFMDYCLNEFVVTEDAFNIFKKEYFSYGIEPLIEFFNSFCRKLNKEHPIYAYVYSQIPDKLKESILNSRKEQEKQKLEIEKREQSYSEDFHIAFDQKKLMSEVLSIFDFFETDEVMKDNFFNHDMQELSLEKNQFALFLFRFSYWSECEYVKKENFIEYISMSNWEMNFMIQLVRYNSRHKISFDDFTEEEIQKCIVWVKLVLDKYPLDSVDSSFKYIHLILSFVIRNSNFLLRDKEFMDSYREKIIALAFSGFPNVLVGGFMVSYDSYSFEYLEQYLNSKKLMIFIFNNFTHSFSDHHKMISVCGYIAEHISEVLPYQRLKLRKEISEYLEKNLGSFYYPAITECAFALGFLITDLDENKLASAFLLDDKGYELSHNIAASFLRYQQHEKTDDEVLHLLKALKLAFYGSSEEFFKKTIAEYYISLNKKAGDIFLFYADYLLSNDDHPINNYFVNHRSSSSLATSDIIHLNVVQKLLIYSREKKGKSERRDGILEMAISSYKGISENIQDRDELEKVLISMKTVAALGHGFICRQIQEIQNTFAERTYQPITVEKIITLK